jgi:hypothetical protein
MLAETKRNYPEEYKKGPHCPHTKLVEICASLTGIELSPESFCYEQVENATYSRGAIPWLETADISAKASCIKVNKLLCRQLSTVSVEVNLPSGEEVQKKVDLAQDIDTKTKILEEYKTTKEKYTSRQDILDRWRKVIFNTSCATPADEPNPHFRSIKQGSDLTEEEIITKVRQFNSALTSITGYKPNTFFFGGEHAVNCHQTPRSYDVDYRI